MAKNPIPKIGDMWEYSNQEDLHIFYIVLEYFENPMHGDEVLLYCRAKSRSRVTNMVYHKNWRLVK